jgi:hypothetical protein
LDGYALVQAGHLYLPMLKKVWLAGKTQTIRYRLANSLTVYDKVPD